MATTAIAHYLAMAAGLVVVLAGAFVLAARPHHALHRLFFLLALTDGGSTILYRASVLAATPELASYFRATYWYFFLAFIVLLVLFGLRFPLARMRESATRAWATAALAGGFLVGALYVLDHGRFWTMTVSAAGAPSFAYGPAGNLMTAVLVASLALLALLLTRDILRSASTSHRRQAAFVLGGMTLAYGPYATTSLASGALVNAERAFLTGSLAGVVAYWTFAAYCIILLASAWRLMRLRDPARAQERTVMLASYAGVVLLTLPALVWPSAEALSAMRAVAFVSYPALLAYSIVRYEVFDIDRQVRRAATLTLVIGALALVFLIAENLLQSLLQERLLGGLSSELAAGTLAAIAVAGVTVPITRVSRKAASRIVPELSHDALHKRKLDVYRHSLAGALADGFVEERESRTLTALRESLGISAEEHEVALAQVRRSLGATTG